MQFPFSPSMAACHTDPVYGWDMRMQPMHSQCSFSGQNAVQLKALATHKQSTMDSKPLPGREPHNAATIIPQLLSRPRLQAKAGHGSKQKAK